MNSGRAFFSKKETEFCILSYRLLIAAKQYAITESKVFATPAFVFLFKKKIFVPNFYLYNKNYTYHIFILTCFKIALVLSVRLKTYRHDKLTCH